MHASNILKAAKLNVNQVTSSNGRLPHSLIESYIIYLIYGFILSQISQPMRSIWHTVPQLSQVCTQGGLCDQLQSKTELEDTQAQDRKAGIVRRKHLEEISDDEDMHWDPGKGTGCLICEGILLVLHIGRCLSFCSCCRVFTKLVETLLGFLTELSFSTWIQNPSCFSCYRQPPMAGDI